VDGRYREILGEFYTEYYIPGGQRSESCENMRGFKEQDSRGGTPKRIHIVNQGGGGL